MRPLVAGTLGITGQLQAVVIVEFVDIDIAKLRARRTDHNRYHAGQRAIECRLHRAVLGWRLSHYELRIFHRWWQHVDDTQSCFDR